MGYIIIANLLEALGINILLHALYGKKKDYNWQDAIYIVVDVGCCRLFDALQLGDRYMFIGYVIIFLYGAWRFHDSLNCLLVSGTLCIFISAVLQLAAGVFVSVSIGNMLTEEMLYVVYNLLFLLLTILLTYRLPLSRWVNYLLEKRYSIVATVMADIVILLYFITTVRKEDGLFVVQAAAVLALVFLFVVLAISLGKSVLHTRSLQVENEMQRLYHASFEGLVGEIRLRQHEFDNHLSAIYGMRYSYHTYETLVAAQEEYAHSVISENKYNKLLSCGNYTLAGFLYQKFSEIEKDDIAIFYRVAVREMACGVPMYVLIEMTGNLLDNAREALQRRSCEKALRVVITEDADAIGIEIANRSVYIPYDDIDRFFEKGISSKGAGHGYGLYHVKQRCEAYHIQLLCTNKEIESETCPTGNYLSFTLRVEKQRKDQK